MGKYFAIIFLFLSISSNTFADSNKRYADVLDYFLFTLGQRPFTGQEYDFINKHNMSVVLMYKDAKDAWESSEWFAIWLKENHNYIYIKNVMTKENFPNSQMSHHNGGLADAFRHIYWTAQIAQRYGKSIAEEFTDLHERINFETNSLVARNSEILNKTNETITSNTWKHFEVNTENLHAELKVILNASNTDIHLFVKQGSKPTHTTYPCHTIEGSTHEEICNIPLWQSAVYYIGIYAMQVGDFNIKAFLLDDTGISSDQYSKLTPMDYHNNYIGAYIGDNNKDISDDALKNKVRDYIMGNISTEINAFNSHTQLPQNKVAIYKSLSNGSSELCSFDMELNLPTIRSVITGTEIR